jgi:phosphoribosyl-ATP pyrophosphohydrolase/phosphoribosyl-AMP cyclohydrolase/histidinol dehydrogenase
MTAVTARAAGVKQVIVASPRPAPITLAAAAEAGADLLVAAGGAQAVAALAFGTSRFEPCDIVVGPGNRWVNAAKALVTPWVAIDSLAGPSELVVVADASADPALVAADLLAQAEHDDDARCVLIALDARLVDAVRNQLLLQLEDLPTAATAAQSLLRGSSLVVESAEEAACAVDALAPEHVQLLLNEAAWLAQRLRHYGALFLGRAGAEVLGDYGSGPNHVLPTGGAARRKGGLSVLDFLRVRTWLELEEAPDAADASQLARLEGLEAHARAADRRVRNVPASASTEGIT